MMYLAKKYLSGSKNYPHLIELGYLKVRSKYFSYLQIGFWKRDSTDVLILVFLMQKLSKETVKNNIFSLFYVRI